MSTTTELTAIAATEELCEWYRQECGFDVSVNKFGNIVLRTGVIDGLQIPRELGDRVRKLLSDNMLRTPVITNNRTRYLMFLTGPAPKGDDRPLHLRRMITDDEDEAAAARSLRMELFRLAAIRTMAGAEITLPGMNDAVRSWLCPPDGMFAEFGRVVGLAVEAAAVVSARREVRR